MSFATGDDLASRRKSEFISTLIAIGTIIVYWFNRIFEMTIGLSQAIRL